MNFDTIVAFATATSQSSIGIIRISGDDSIKIANQLFKSPNVNKSLLDVASHTIHYGFIYDEHQMIDEVMISIMKAPKTFTREHVVEINCHGGPLVMQKILQLVVSKGARIAMPGEFSKRAFLNGRIDLSKAEAIMDLIAAKNDYALHSSINQLNGKLSNQIVKIRNDLLYEIAFIESALDDPEHVSLEGYPDQLKEKLSCMIQNMSLLIESGKNGLILKEGIKTVIVGKPNAGKSSLLNLLSGTNKAIVTDIAGTTRDTIEETILLNGIQLLMIDTAGIRSTDDVVERIGVDLAIETANKADLIIYVVDSSKSIDDSDHQIISVIKDKNVIILFNKSDLEQVCTKEDVVSLFLNHNNTISFIKTSTKENIGLDLLAQEIEKLVLKGNVVHNDELIITNMRHQNALVHSREALELVIVSILNGMPEDFFTIDLMNAYQQLGYIIGEEIEDDLVEEIFSKFCTGK